MESVSPECKRQHAECSSKGRETAYFHGNEVLWELFRSSSGCPVDNTRSPRLSTPPVGFSWHLVRRGTVEKHLSRGRALSAKFFEMRHQMTHVFTGLPLEPNLTDLKYCHSYLKSRNIFLMGKLKWHGLNSFSKYTTTKIKSTTRISLQHPPHPALQQGGLHCNL